MKGIIGRRVVTEDTFVGRVVACAPKNSDTFVLLVMREDGVLLAVPDHQVCVVVDKAEFKDLLRKDRSWRTRLKREQAAREARENAS